MTRGEYLNKSLIALLISLFLIIPIVSATDYVMDMGLITSQSIYTINESIELKGFLYLSNYSGNGTLMLNHTPLANASINITMINKDNNSLVSKIVV